MVTFIECPKCGKHVAECRYRQETKGRATRKWIDVECPECGKYEIEPNEFNKLLPSHMRKVYDIPDKDDIKDLVENQGVRDYIYNFLETSMKSGGVGDVGEAFGVAFRLISTVNEKSQITEPAKTNLMKIRKYIEASGEFEAETIKDIIYNTVRKIYIRITDEAQKQIKPPSGSGSGPPPSGSEGPPSGGPAPPPSGGGGSGDIPYRGKGGYCPKCKKHTATLKGLKRNKKGEVTHFIVHCPKCGFSEIPAYEFKHYTKRREQMMDYYDDLRDFKERKKEEYGVGHFKELSYEQKKEYLESLKDFEEDSKKKYDLIARDSIFKKGKKREDSLRTRKMKENTSAFNTVQNKVGKRVMDGFIFAALLGIGVVVSATIGADWWMILAFLSFGLYYLLPDPESMDVPKDIRKKIEKISKEQFEKKSGPVAAGRYYTELTKAYLAKGNRVNSGFGFLKTLTKLSGFGMLIWSLSNTNVPMVNIIIIVLAFVAYYSCKIVYDPVKPHEMIESLFRFGFLGIYVIPIFIFITQFDSWVLGLIAFAFFAIPPIPKEKGNEEMYAATELGMKFLFFFIMLAAGVGFLIGWEGWSLPTAMKSTFIYFWIITGISGFFSPSEARPGVGFIMLTSATIIYGLGPGQQELMSGLLGPWWPTVQNTLDAIGQPLTDAFSGMGNTFSSGWLMMTNPVGYATQLMNGSHAENPQGVTGAHGIEFNSFTISGIYPNQPFMANVILRNNGAFEAENVRLYMGLTGDIPKIVSTVAKHEVQLPSAEEMEISHLGFDCAGKGDADDYMIKDLCLYSDESNDYFSKNNPTMDRQYVNQYTLEGQINCTTVNEYDLRNKAIPLRATVVYDYQSDSTVDVEFISEDEWNRLATANELDSKLRFIQSQYSSAPVKFPIGTAGLKNPILATQAFHISLLIDSDMGTRSRVKNVKAVELYYPKDWELDDSGCTGPIKANPVAIQETNNNKLTFVYKTETAGAKTIVCHFKALDDNKMGSSPTKTYRVTAHTNYTFEMWKDVSTKIQFGGFCCSDKDCPTGYECDDTAVGNEKPTYSCSPEGSVRYNIVQVTTPEEKRTAVTEPLVLENYEVTDSSFKTLVKSSREFVRLEAYITLKSSGEYIGSGDFEKDPPAKYDSVYTGKPDVSIIGPSTTYTNKVTIYFSDGTSETKTIDVTTNAK